MSDDQRDDRNFGALLAQARTRAELSIREAARRADISEGLWRQLENGYKSVGRGLTVPTNPRPRNVIAAARAVGLDVVQALEAAGHHREADEQRALVPEVRPPLSVVPAQSEAERQPLEDDNEVLAAIRRDPDLDDSARAHFLNQYVLLRDLSRLKKGDSELLPYVAHGKRTTPVDPDEEAAIEARTRAAVRENPESPHRDK